MNSAWQGTYAYEFVLQKSFHKKRKSAKPRPFPVAPKKHRPTSAKKPKLARTVYSCICGNPNGGTHQAWCPRGIPKCR